MDFLLRKKARREYKKYQSSTKTGHLWPALKLGTQRLDSSYRQLLEDLSSEENQVPRWAKKLGRGRQASALVECRAPGLTWVVLKSSDLPLSLHRTLLGKLLTSMSLTCDTGTVTAWSLQDYRSPGAGQGQCGRGACREGKPRQE